EAALGDDQWRRARGEILARLARSLGVDSLRAPADPGAGQHALFMFLAGLTSVADWIGSNKAYFPPAGRGTDPAAYIPGPPGRARRALEELGWLGWAPEESRPLPFASLFPAVAEPRPLQEAVERLGPAPGLVLVESPMGEGKTEAALFLADRWTHAAGHR